jgi:structure-specific recognition protein 1
LTPVYISIRRAPTAFILWSNDNRDAVKKENSALSFGEVGKVLGEKWKNVSGDEKARYEQKSAELKLQWQKNMAAWTAEHGDEESGM